MRKGLGAKLKELAHSAVLTLDGALYPENCTCDNCGAELVANMRYRLCSECMDALPLNRGRICLSCGAPLTDEADYCNRCMNSEAAYGVCRSPLIYEDEARLLVHKLKFGGKKYLAHTLGALMADEFVRQGMNADIVVFVPMTTAEQKARGFNQSELLANEVSSRLNLPLLPALVKVKDTAAQKKLTGKERAANLEGAFSCVYPQVKNLRILLVDDVFTTGATANECAKVLLKAKAIDVSVLTAAVTRLHIPVESEDGERFL